MSNTVYQMLINNTANFLRSYENRKNIEKGEGMNAFHAAYVLSVALCKSKEEILADLITCKL